MGDILEKGDENMANDDWDIDWDIFDKEINRSIETARKTMDLCIEPYIKELAIYKRALELACEKYINVDGISYVLRDDKGYFDKSDEQIQKETIDYFISQAKKELEEQNG